MPEAITEDELAEALIFFNYHGAESKARTLFTHALNRRTSPRNPQVNGEEAITAAELSAALKRLGYSSPLHADRLVKDILKHKPEFEPGDIVLSGTGKVYVLRKDFRWRCPGEPNTYGYGYNYPARPWVKIGVTA